MKCPVCGTEMKSGYTFLPGIAGVSRLVKMEPGLHKTAVPQAALCPNCGKLELYLPPEKIPFIEEL